MYRTDDPVADADRHDREEQRWRDRLPRCVYCRQRIVEDKCYLINDELVCKECLEREHEKNTEDYTEL